MRENLSVLIRDLSPAHFLEPGIVRSRIEADLSEPRSVQHPRSRWLNPACVILSRMRSVLKLSLATVGGLILMINVGSVLAQPPVQSAPQAPGAAGGQRTN